MERNDIIEMINDYAHSPGKGCRGLLVDNGSALDTPRSVWWPNISYRSNTTSPLVLAGSYIQDSDMKVIGHKSPLQPGDKVYIFLCTDSYLSMAKSSLGLSMNEEIREKIEFTVSKTSGSSVYLKELPNLDFHPDSLISIKDYDFILKRSSVTIEDKLNDFLI